MNNSYFIQTFKGQVDIDSVGRSDMTPEVAWWATQLLISGNMIKQKTCKFCVDN